MDNVQTYFLLFFRATKGTLKSIFYEGKILELSIVDCELRIEGIQNFVQIAKVVVKTCGKKLSSGGNENVSGNFAAPCSKILEQNLYDFIGILAT